MKRCQPWDWLLLSGLLLLSLVPRLPLLLFKGFDLLHADHVIFGLMAKHILEGKFMIYYYGQGYMGPLESLIAALIYFLKLRGMDVISLGLPPLIFFVSFLMVNFHLLKRLFGLEVSFVANLLLSLPPPELSVLGVTAMGGYMETLFFGSLTLLGLVHYLESKGRRRILFLTGLAAGIGYWTSNLILMYFIAIGVFWLLGTPFWRKLRESLGWRRVFLLQDMGIPPLLRWLAVAVHFVIVGFILWHAFSFFTGETFSFGKLKIEMASPPFHVKKVKKILLLFIGEFVTLSLVKLGIRKCWNAIRPALPLFGGFFLGAAPVFLYSLLGGEGYRLIHGSGAVLATEFPRQLQAVVWRDFVGGVWGVPIHSLEQEVGLESIAAWTVLIISLGLLFYFGLCHKKDLRKLWGFRASKYPYSIFPVILALVTVAICLFINLRAGRYLLATYFSVSLIFALALAQMRRKLGFLSVLFLVILLANQGYANFHYFHEIPNRDRVKRGHEAILRLLEERGIRGRYAHYVTNYILTFESQERIIVAPYRSHDRYPTYTKYVEGLDRVAYLFEETDSFVGSFQKALDDNRISYEKTWIEPYWVFVIDRSKRSEKGIV